jgi:hypothetical protein
VRAVLNKFRIPHRRAWNTGRSSSSRISIASEASHRGLYQPCDRFRTKHSSDSIFAKSDERSPPPAALQWRVRRAPVAIRPALAARRQPSQAERFPHHTGNPGV